MEPTVESKKVILIKLHWHILTEVRVFGGLSDHDTLLLRYHDPMQSAVNLSRIHIMIIKKY
jgi:hypothetical protein